MATIHVALANVQARSDTGGTLPVVDSVPLGVDTVTSTATSQLSTLTATGVGNEVWVVTAKDGNVWLKFGTGTPVAAAEDGWLLASGSTRDFAVTTASEKLAIKDA